jgi:uncharacterized protein (TIGR02996 family)
MKVANPIEPDERSIAALEAQFAVELTRKHEASAAKAKALRSDKDFLDAIYAAPNDDAPRLVYADVLLERGDLHGELITLQMLAKPSHEQLDRMTELTSDNERVAKWSHPLSRGGAVVLRHGFPDEIVLDAKTAKSILGEPAFATIRGVDLERISGKLGAEFLDHPALANVQRLKMVRPATMTKLHAKKRAWTYVDVRHAAPPREQTETWTELAEIQLAVQRVFAPDLFAPCTKLHSVRIECQHDFTKAHFESMRNLRRLSLRNVRLSANALVPLEKLEELTTSEKLTPRDLQGLPLRKLSISAALTKAELVAIAKAVPTLCELHVFVDKIDANALMDALGIETLVLAQERLVVRLQGEVAEALFVPDPKAFARTLGSAIEAKRITRIVANDGWKDAWGMHGLEAALEKYKLVLEIPTRANEHPPPSIMWRADRLW